MARYITPELREQIEEANSGIRVDVAIVPAGEASEINERAGQYGVEIERTLPSGVILATGPSDMMMEFLETPAIASASEPDRAQVLN